MDLAGSPPNLGSPLFLFVQNCIFIGGSKPPKKYKYNPISPLSEHSKKAETLSCLLLPGEGELALRKSDFSTVELLPKKNPIFSQGGRRDGIKFRTRNTLCTNQLFLYIITEIKLWKFVHSLSLRLG